MGTLYSWNQTLFGNDGFYAIVRISDTGRRKKSQIAVFGGF